MDQGGQPSLHGPHYSKHDIWNACSVSMAIICYYARLLFLQVRVSDDNYHSVMG